MEYKDKKSTNDDVLGCDPKYNILLNEPLERYNSWRVGGKAKYLYVPESVAELKHFLPTIKKTEPILWLGLGSNVLVSDEGFAGMVIVTQAGIDKLELLASNKVRAEAGVSCAKMARFCARNNLANAEFWAGIPGTMGGALRMNAGCFNQETWNFVESIETINRFGEIQIKKPTDFKISYRTVEGLDIDEWFIAATFSFPSGDKQESLDKIKHLLDHRAATQPTGDYNCGSVFRNPPGDYAGRLIESCGLKGMSEGGAQVSTKHANFIINVDKNASAQDIAKLIEKVRNIVYEKQAIELFPEVHFL